MTMAREFHKYPHEILELDLADWSFNLLCLVLDSDKKDVPEKYDDTILKLRPQMQDKKHQEELAKFNSKLPRSFRDGKRR